MYHLGAAAVGFSSRCVCGEPGTAVRGRWEVVDVAPAVGGREGG